MDFDPIWQWPKPLQHPHPPVFIGGNGPRVLDRVLRYGDGWMPNMKDLETLPPRIAELRERAGARVPVTYYGGKPETLRRPARGRRGPRAVRARVGLRGRRAGLDTLPLSER